MPKASDIFFLFFTGKRINLVDFPHTELKKKKIAYSSGSKNITEPFEGLKKSTSDAL